MEILAEIPPIIIRAYSMPQKVFFLALLVATVCLYFYNLRAINASTRNKYSKKGNLYLLLTGIMFFCGKVVAIKFTNSLLPLYFALNAISGWCAVSAAGYFIFKDRVVTDRSIKRFRFLVWIIPLTSVIFYLRYGYILYQVRAALSSPKTSISFSHMDSALAIRWPRVSDRFYDFMMLENAHLYSLGDDCQTSLKVLDEVSDDSYYAFDVFRLRAFDYQRTGEFQKALTSLESALQYKKSVPELLMLRGLIRAKMTEYPEALKDLTASIECDPKVPSPYVLRATINLFFNRKDESIESDLKFYMDAVPEDCRGRVLAGISALDAGSFDKASQYFESVESGHTTYCRDIPWKALVWLRQRNTAKALELYGTALQKNKDLKVLIDTENNKLRIPSRYYSDFMTLEKLHNQAK